MLRAEGKASISLLTCDVIDVFGFWSSVGAVSLLYFEAKPRAHRFILAYKEKKVFWDRKNGGGNGSGLLQTLRTYASMK